MPGRRPGRASFMLRDDYRRPFQPAMKIQKDSVVTLRYKVADAKGKLIEESKEPMTYLHGGYGNTLPKITETDEPEQA